MALRVVDTANKFPTVLSARCRPVVAGQGRVQARGESSAGFAQLWGAELAQDAADVWQSTIGRGFQP